MDKIMITRDMVMEPKTFEIDCGNGVVIHVVDHIPYDSKEAFAMEYAMYRNIQDDENQIMYDNYKYVVIKSLLLAKYYTDIDISNMDNEEAWNALFDFFVMSNVYEKILEITKDDMKYVEDISNNILSSVRQSYRRSNSLDYKIMRTYGFLFSGQDLTQAIAKASDVNNEMVSMIGAEKEVAKQKTKKNDKLTIDGGAVLNIAKKRTGTKKE